MTSILIILGLGFTTSVITYILMREMEGARLFQRKPRVEGLEWRIAPSSLGMTVVKPPKVQPQVEIH